MTNLVKIQNVYLCTTSQAGVNITAECDAARTLLTNNGIKFSELWYNDPTIDERTPVLKSFSTWTWKGGKQRTFDTFPIIYWTECYDDWSTETDNAVGLREIENSTLVLNKSLVT